MSEQEAGRELDMLIAEKVLGWRRSGYAWVDQHDRVKASYGCPPGFSTDIAMAWRVVKYLRAKGWVFRLRCDDDESLASFVRSGDPYVDWAPSVPLAICRAALLAVEEGKSE